MIRRLPPLLTVVALALALPMSLAASTDESPLKTVESFMAAYNAHDVDAMVALSHPEIQWLSLEGAAIAIEAEGADALKAAMESYFAAIPSSRSVAESTMEAGRFVSVWERAEWQGKDGPQSQSALAVYEVEDRKIRRVWYYPAQRSE